MRGARIGQFVVATLAASVVAGCANSGPAGRATPTTSGATSSAAPTTRTPIPPPTRVRSPLCTWPELAIDYYGGGAGAGSDFGLIRLRDVAATPCEIGATVRLVGLNAAGVPDTERLTYRAPPFFTLTPRTRRIEAGRQAPTGIAVATIQIAASYRDDPTSANGLCQARRVIPARWRVTLATGSGTVANASNDDPFPAFRSLLTCAGELDVPSPIVSL